MSFFPGGHRDGAQPLGDSEGSGHPSSCTLSPVLILNPEPRARGSAASPVPSSKRQDTYSVQQGLRAVRQEPRVSVPPPQLETASRTSLDTPLYPWLRLPSDLSAPLPHRNPGPKHPLVNHCTLTNCSSNHGNKSNPAFCLLKEKRIA